MLPRSKLKHTSHGLLLLLLPAAPAAAAEGGDKKAAAPERLTHSLDILEAFGVLGLEVPTSADRMAPLAAVVAAKKEHYLQK